MVHRKDSSTHPQHCSRLTEARLRLRQLRSQGQPAGKPGIVGIFEHVGEELQTSHQHWEELHKGGGGEDSESGLSMGFLSFPPLGPF